MARSERKTPEVAHCGLGTGRWPRDLRDGKERKRRVGRHFVACEVALLQWAIGGVRTMCGFHCIVFIVEVGWSTSRIFSPLKAERPRSHEVRLSIALHPRDGRLCDGEIRASCSGDNGKPNERIWKWEPQKRGGQPK